jgi:hypothetical protein
MSTPESVALPGSPGYLAATGVFNLSAPAHPAAAITARTTAHIRAAIRYARAEGLPVRVHTTGHASAGTRPMDGSVLIKTELDGTVDIDAARRVARIPAGTKWGPVVTALAPYGLAAPHGSSATVGVVGYLLRGGISFYSRKVGLASNSVRAVELITADGELRRVDTTNDPELFWAIRGGGGGFGVVTAIEVDLFPATSVITGSAIWRAEHSQRLLSIWRKWTVDAPPEAATSIRWMNVPPLPDVPPFLSEGTVFVVDGAILSTADDDTVAREQAEDLLGPLRAVAEPVMDSWESTTPSALLATHMDPEDPVPYLGDHLLLNDIGEAGEAELLRLLNGKTPLVTAGLRQLGGALSIPDSNGGVLNHLDALYAYSGSGVPGFPGVTEESVLQHNAVVREALAPWETGRTAPTFVESYRQPQRHMTEGDIVAVDRVRARIDPTGLFRADIAPNATADG